MPGLALICSPPACSTRSCGRGSGRQATWIVVLAYALNPAVIFNSAIWGQTDSLFTLELFLGALLLFEGRIAFGWALLMVAASPSLRPLIFLPLLASWKGNWDRPERPIIAAATGLAVATILTLPFVEPLAALRALQQGSGLLRRDLGERLQSDGDPRRVPSVR